VTLLVVVLIVAAGVCAVAGLAGVGRVNWSALGLLLVVLALLIPALAHT